MICRDVLHRFAVFVTRRASIFTYLAACRLASDEVRARMIAEGGEPEPTTPEQHAAVIDREESKWSAVIRAAGIQAR